MKKLIFSFIMIFSVYLAENVYSETVKNKPITFAIGSAFYDDGELKNALISKLKKMGCQVTDFTSDNIINKKNCCNSN